MYCTADQVVQLTGISYKKFNFGSSNTPEADFITMIEEWISQAEDLINTYCNVETFTENNITPPAIQNITIRLTRNMVNLAQVSKNTDVIKVDDWTIDTVKSDIFTDDLKRDLKPFKVDKFNTAHTVSFSAITGD